MSRFEDFAKRYLVVKEGVQGLAEQELAKANTVYAAEMNALQETIQALANARKERSFSAKTAADIAAWDNYVNRLESIIKNKTTVISALRDSVDEKRKYVKEAYIDQKKWSTIVEQNTKKNLQRHELAAGRQADENAVMRHGRST